MMKAGLLGAMALIMSSSLTLADSGQAFAPQAVSKYETVMSSAHVARLKSVLKLTAEQERLWPAIDRAFREISQSQEVASTGVVQKIKQRVSQVALNTFALRRLATAAQPLIRTLSDEQKQNALTFARSMGLHSVALAF
jgi:hypothetical protein